MHNRQVVVTGVGVVCPVGAAVDKAWEAVVAGRSGVRKISSFDASGLRVRIAAPVEGFDADAYIPEKEQKRMDLFIHYGIGAGVQAIEDSGFEVTEQNAPRIGVAVGSGIGGLPLIEANHTACIEGGARKISPFFVPGSIINMISGNLSILYGLQGPNFAIVSACATGNHNIGESARMVARGDADIMIAGGAEMATSLLGVGGFAAARALCASHNDDPERASRPWDLDRDGFVIGDGAGVVVLEEREHAHDHARKLAMSSVKSMIGHLLGAAGGVEAVFSVLSLRDGVMPPTVNLDTPDPKCDLDYVPNTARRENLRCVLSNSFGFGGTNASLVFRAV